MSSFDCPESEPFPYVGEVPTLEILVGGRFHLLLSRSTDKILTTLASLVAELWLLTSCRVVLGWSPILAPSYR